MPKSRPRAKAAGKARQQRRSAQQARPGGQTPATDVFREQILACLRRYEAWNQAELGRFRKVEADGKRLVDGGQTSQDGWQVHDLRTRELLAEGGGGYDGYLKALSELDPENTWYDYEVAISDVYGDFEDVPVVDGMPQSLAEALSEWVADKASYEEIAGLTGLDAEYVERCLTEALVLLRREPRP